MTKLLLVSLILLSGCCTRQIKQQNPNIYQPQFYSTQLFRFQFVDVPILQDFRGWTKEQKIYYWRSVWDRCNRRTITMRALVKVSQSDMDFAESQIKKIELEP